MMEIIKMLVEWIRSGHAMPSRDELISMAKEAARDEAEALKMALALSNLASASSNVLTAFRTKPQEVPVLNIDITVEKP